MEKEAPAIVSMPSWVLDVLILFLMEKEAPVQIPIHPNHRVGLNPFSDGKGGALATALEN